MYLRHSTVRKNGKTHTYWRLVRSVRVGCKVRQVTVAQLGELDAEGPREGLGAGEALPGRRETAARAVRGPAPTEPLTVDPTRSGSSGAAPSAMSGWPGSSGKALGSTTSARSVCRPGARRCRGREVAAILVLARLCEPSSELHIAEDWYRRTALEDLLGVAAEQVHDDAALPRSGPTAAAQGGARSAPEGAARRAVRPGLRPAALRRDLDLLRGRGEGESAGAARLHPRSGGRTASRSASGWS